MSNRRYNSQTRKKFFAGGGADSGKVGEAKSQLMVAEDKYKSKPSFEKLSDVREKAKKYKETRKNLFGGGSSNKKMEQLKKLLSGQNKKPKQKQKPSMMMVAMKGQK